MVENKKLFRKRIFRRLTRYKFKLAIIFLIAFTTTAIFISFFVGASSVLESVEQFNEEYNVEDGTFISMETPEENEAIELEEVHYGEVRDGDRTLRIFSPREEINKYQVTSGEDLQSENDILIDYNFMEENDLEIGDEIDFKSTTFTIVGAAISPDYITTKNSNLVLQANSKKFGIAFIQNEKFDELFSDDYISYYAYTSDLSIREISDEMDALFISDSDNNSRIQLVIGDAKAPRDLAVLLTFIFYFIVIILLSVYHYEVSKKEEQNIHTFNHLGYTKRKIFGHYVMETNITLLVAWIIGVIVGTMFIDEIMQMNSKLYNYPILDMNIGLWVFAVVLSLILFFASNLFLVYQFYARTKKKEKKVKQRKGKSTAKRSKIPFPYRYRLLKLVRNKKELILFVSLIFFVGLLLNFSFLLKDSVEVYVEDLGEENTFEQMYFLTQEQPYDEKEGDEAFKLYSLYDETDTLQNVYVIPDDSTYFSYGTELQEDDVIISDAFAQKYNKDVGDTIVLTDIVNEEEYNLQIDKINNSTTASNIYLVSNDDETIFDDSTYYTPAIASTAEHEELEHVEAVITRDEIMTSGESILNVINIQISLVVVIAIVFQVALLYSLLEFSYQNSIHSIRILKLEGFKLKELMQMHFGLNFLFAIIFVGISYYVTRYVVRVFLDQIMYDFVNFVEITNNFWIILLTNGMILLIYLYYLIRTRRKIAKL